MKQLIKLSGLFLVIFCVIYTFYQVQWSVFLNAIENINVSWVLTMASALICSMFLRSVRWQIIIGPPWIDLSKVWEASRIGYLATAIYPARAGDVLKIVRLQKISGIGAGKLVMSSIIDRIMDGLASCVLLVCLAAIWGKTFNPTFGVWTIAHGFLIALILILIFYYLIGNRFKFFLRNRLTKNESRWTWLNHVYKQSLAGANIFKSPKLILTCIVIQSLITFFDILACLFLFWAFHWGALSFYSATVMLIYIATACFLPSTPGFIGVYQIAAVFALSKFGIDESSAVAYGTVFQTISFILFVGFGLTAQFRKTQNILNGHELVAK